MAFTLQKLCYSRWPPFADLKTSKLKASALIWDINCFMILGLRDRCEFEVCLWHSHCANYAFQHGCCSPIILNFGNPRKTYQRSKPLLWFERSFASLHDSTAEKQEWVWGMSTAFTLWKLHDSQCRHLPIVQNSGSPRKTCQSLKPTLWFELSFPIVHNIWAEEQESVWGKCLAFTLRKLSNSRCPSIENGAKCWKSQKTLSKPKASTLIWAIISFRA